MVQLGSTTYTSVTWTAGDVITEAKLDNMVANDQAYDSHASQGLLLNNNKSFAAKQSGGTNTNIATLNSSDELDVGEAGIWQKGYTKFTDIVTATDSATVTFDLSQGIMQKVTLGGNRTLALSNEKTGMVFYVLLIQDGTGSRTVTWWSNVKHPGGTAPTLSTDAGAIDIFACIKTGASEYLVIPVGYDFS